ncbi:MAG: hypothetical protein CVU41_01270 [Chloroflexi bacterium HGW-Chloroflexi-3]|nr:MAG: hypothetical protein CVU41_01270 [Chloroflexi bacterium HGW-Chloroflexi-3]
MSELVELASVLGIKIDSHTTKLFLFDVVDGKFHLLATSEADTSYKPPYNDIREGFFKAVDNLQQISGRMIIDDDMNLIVPSQTDGSGIDQIAFTYGFLNQISIITAGLLEGVSISSLTHLINSTHMKHSDQISLNDPRKIDDILSSTINHRPDLILLSGGTENGANKSVLRMMEIILFCIKHLPKEKIPELVYAGNSSIATKIQEMASPIAKLSITENIRPTLEDENLSPALTFINELSSQMMAKKIPGFEYLFSVTKSVPLPYNQANGIMTKFLNKLGNEKNGNILVIDLSKEIILMAGINNGTLHQNAVENSLFNNPERFISETNIRDISNWLPKNKEKEFINDYVWGKSIRPYTIPSDKDELFIEISIIKNLIRKNYQQFNNKFGISSDYWNQIVINGDYLSKFENPNDIAIILLDAIQPKGITNLFLDQHGILPVLGNIAVDNPILPIQILEGSSISLLAKVFSIQSKAKIGTPILKVRLEFKDGTYLEEQIVKGAITKLPLLAGQIVKLFFEPLSNIDMNQFGKNIDKGFIIQGGLCGVIFDARGRPIPLQKNNAERFDQFQKWYKSMDINLA